jgi:hypothetical protein
MKKGLVAIWISLFFSAVTIALLLVFYFLVFRGSRTPDSIQATESFSATSNTVLSQYLSRQVVVNGEKMTISDLIRLSYPEWQSPDIVKWQQANVKFPIDGYPDKYAMTAVLVKETYEFLRIAEFSYEGQTGSFGFVFQAKPYRDNFGSAYPLIPIIRTRVQADCIGGNNCPDLAGAYVPVSDSEAVFVGVWGLLS